MFIERPNEDRKACFVLTKPPHLINFDQHHHIIQPNFLHIEFEGCFAESAKSCHSLNFILSICINFVQFDVIIDVCHVRENPTRFRELKKCNFFNIF